MSTIQSAIRTAVRSAVKTATGLSDAQIFQSPRIKVPIELFPAISIYSLSDRSVDPDADHLLPHDRIYQYVVDVQIQGAHEEDATDALAIKIRQAILADDTYGQLVLRTQWTDQQWGGLDLAPPISGTALTFESHYRFHPNEEA